MFFKRSKTVGVPVEVYKIFKELADKHENIQVIDNDGVIELRDPRLPYFPIIWIGKGVIDLRSKHIGISPQTRQCPLTPTQTPSLFSFPFRAVKGSRPTFIYGTVGERGLAHGAWSAVAATSGAQEWLRPRGVSAPHGTVPSRRSDSGDLRGAGVAPATHVGGQRPAPTGRMPGESPATVIHGRGDSACMAVEG
jgi:hypothetical protein